MVSSGGTIQSQVGKCWLVLLGIEHVLLGATVLTLDDLLEAVAKQVLICSDGTAQITYGPCHWQELLCIPESVQCEDEA